MPKTEHFGAIAPRIRYRQTILQQYTINASDCQSIFSQNRKKIQKNDNHILRAAEKYGKMVETWGNDIRRKFHEQHLARY
nr:MAG TPA: hypothetical protein [Caudoviricetes sp.]